MDYRMTKTAINRTFEVMGLQAALAQNLEVDTIIETEAPDRQEFYRVRDAQGLRAAVAWLESRFPRGAR